MRLLQPHTAGYLTLHESFNRDGSACCIAMEHRRFIETLGEICLPGNPAVKRTYGVVMGMLELDPADRLDISSVLAQIRRSYGVQGCSQFSWCCVKVLIQFVSLFCFLHGLLAIITPCPAKVGG